MVAEIDARYLLVELALRSECHAMVFAATAVLLRKFKGQHIQFEIHFGGSMANMSVLLPEHRTFFAFAISLTPSTSNFTSGLKRNSISSLETRSRVADRVSINSWECMGAKVRKYACIPLELYADGLDLRTFNNLSPARCGSIHWSNISILPDALRTSPALGSATGCTVGRFIVYNFADTRDHKKFPSRPLEASAEPYHYTIAAEEKGRRMITYDGKEQAFDDFLEDHKTVAFLIIHRDTLKYERYFNSYDPAHVHTSFSMAKSVMSMLIGCAIADGYIADVDGRLPTSCRN